MTKYLTVVPAYGRDYKSKKAVLVDWNAGKDFLVQDICADGYINKDDKPANVTLHVHYDRLMKSLLIP